MEALRIAIATAQHLMVVSVESCDASDTRNWRITDTEVLLSGQTFATVAESPGGGLVTISHRDTVGSRGGKMGDMYITQFTPDGGIVDRGHEPWLRHAHTADFLPDGTLVITNTAFNELDFIRGNERHAIYIGPEGEDTHHINATCRIGNYLYVMAHNANRTEDVSGEIYEVDLDGLQITGSVELPHIKCHHFFGDEGAWIYTASDDGRIVRWAPGSSGWEEVVVGGFNKGLERADEDLAVFATSEHTPFVERRVKSHAQLGFLNLQTFEVTEMLDLMVANKGAGQVNDISIISNVD